MELYRISKKKHVRDLSGEGARIYGGRWNRKGIPLLYTSEHISLAALEVLVHTPISELPDDLQIAVIDAPDQVSTDEIPVEDLPGNWRAYPPSEAVVRTGSEWIESGLNLALKVPSAVIPWENNILLNPRHADMDKVYVKEVRDFIFDKRLSE